MKPGKWRASILVVVRNGDRLWDVGSNVHTFSRGVSGLRRAERFARTAAELKRRGGSRKKYNAKIIDLARLEVLERY